jgi:hypothetical protein
LEHWLSSSDLTRVEFASHSEIVAAIFWHRIFISPDESSGDRYIFLEQ